MAKFKWNLANVVVSVVVIVLKINSLSCRCWWRAYGEPGMAINKYIYTYIILINIKKWAFSTQRDIKAYLFTNIYSYIFLRT